MGNNRILPFAQGSGANVMGDDDWADSDVLAQGFQAGRAASIKYNKALRQATSVASGFGQFTADYGGLDFSDSLSPQAMRDGFRIALAAALDGTRIGVDTSSIANQITFPLTPLPTSLSGLRTVWFKPNVTNTAGPTTAQITGGSFAALPVKTRSGNDPAAGDLVAGGWYEAVCDGSKFSLVGPVSSELGGNTAIYLSNNSGGQTFTSPGATTFTVPPGVYTLAVQVWGGGGGGGGAANANASSSAGAGGGYAMGKIKVTPLQVLNLVIGAGGTAGSGAQSGTSGGTSSIGSIFATGGGGGAFANGGLASAQAAPGVGSGGTFNLSGNPGGIGFGATSSTSGQTVLSSAGGGTFGTSATPTGGQNGNGFAGYFPGGGGGASACTTAGNFFAGGAGAAGCIALSW